MTESLAISGAKAFAPLLAKLVMEHANRVAAQDPDKLKALRTHVQPHLEATFKRCITIKTLLNPLAPTDFLSIYATQRFKIDETVIDHYGLVDLIRTNANNVIVTGSGGSGKSMFMRYLWLSLFEYSDGRIPLFIELRNMNNVSKNDLLEYIFQSISQGRASITKKDFHRKLDTGDFIIILDGFDELAHERRDEVQATIMSLAQHYPNLKAVVSSRPDDRFVSWSSFRVVAVAPLLKQDTLELIDKAEFDPPSKDRFRKQVATGGLFEKHTSFLTNPLLASMMLLTFSFNFDIPNKMHLFYGQAFDALYQRHDSHKPGGYKREFKTILSEDAFKRLLSYFCLVTYYDQKFTFDREDALNYIRKAISIEGMTVEPCDFLDDLCDCVCVLVKEGMSYAFSHRSFQEYFCAYCVAYVTSKKFEEILKQFAKRPDDQVVSLISDMSPELFRDRYVLPTARAHAGSYSGAARRSAVASFVRALQHSFIIRVRVPPPGAKASALRHPGNLYVAFEGKDGEFADFVSIINKLEVRQNPKNAPDLNLKRDFDFGKHLAQKHGLSDEVEIIVTVDHDVFKYEIRDVASSQSIHLEGAITDEAFSRTSMYDYLATRMKNVSAYVQRAKEQSSRSSNAMNELFDL